jgi:hypothetical protein
MAAEVKLNACLRQIVAEVTPNGNIDSKGYFPLDAGGHSWVLLLGVAEDPKQWPEKQGYRVEKENLASNYPLPTSI